MKTKYIFAALFCQTTLLFSTTASWTGATSTDWNTGDNWSPKTFPNATGDTANLQNGTSTSSPTVNLSASITVGTINFDLGTNYTVSATSPFTLSLQASSGNAQLNVTTTNGNGAHTISAPIVLNSPLVVNQTSTGNFTLSGAITGSQTLTTTGTQTLVLSSNSNGYTGGTVITSGTIGITADANLGSAGTTVTINTGTLLFNDTFTSSRPFTLTGAANISVASTKTATLSGVISDNGSLAKVGSGTLILTNGSNSYKGGTTLGGGVLSISSDAQLGSSTGPLAIGSATLITTSGITSSRSGSFTGAAIIDTNSAANTDTFSGSFGGSGSLTVQGDGTVVLYGNNTYNGGTTVAGSTSLVGTTSGIQGAVTLNTINSNVIFTQTYTGTYSGQLSGPGGLGISAGTITFSGNSTGFTGPTAVTGGSLLVNGSLANSSLTISSGATLGGSGTVGPTTNSGTIDPNGTLSINGALVLSSGSTVNIDVTPLTADSMAVSGHATLDGALIASPSSGFYALDTCYTILTSTTGLTDEFAPPTSTSSNFVPTLLYSGNNVILCLHALQPFFDFPFSNQNTTAVGENINALSLAGALPSSLLNAVDSFAGQSFTSINEALDQMHPAPYSAFTELQAETDSQLLLLFHRLPELRCGCGKTNRVWIEPFGNIFELKKHGMQIGSHTGSGGLALGIDGQFVENLFLGIGGAWNFSYLEWHDQRGHGEVNGFYGAVYADYQIGGFYIGASFFGGADLYDTSRHLNFFTTHQTATASFSALDLAAQLSTAYLFGSSSGYFYPYANFDFLYLHTGEIEEQGTDGLDLNVAKRSDGTFRTEMGLALQVQDTNAAGTMCLTPKVSIGWVNMCPVQRGTLSSTFEGTSIPFTAFGWDQTWNLLSVDFGLALSYCCYSMSAEYALEMSPDENTLLFNQRGNLRLSWNW